MSVQSRQSRATLRATQVICYFALFLFRDSMMALGILGRKQQIWKQQQETFTIHHRRTVEDERGAAVDAEIQRLYDNVDFYSYAREDNTS